MAGNYPDVPSYRMSWDRDGSALVLLDGSAANPQVQGDAAKKAGNDEDGGTLAVSNGSSGGAMWGCIVFPELRDLDGYFIHCTGNPSTWQTSTDTTNGMDGTWTTQSGNFVSGDTATGRRNVTQCTVLGIKAVRFRWTNGYYGQGLASIHLFGEPVPGQNPDRLEIWHPTLDQKIGPAAGDWGNVPRNSSGDRTFRVKNLSSTYTAHSIRVAMEALTDANPSVPAQHSVSTDGAAFYAQTNIGDLAPGAISGIVTQRRVTPSDAILSLWTFRLFAEAASWS